MLSLCCPNLLLLCSMKTEAVKKIGIDAEANDYDNKVTGNWYVAPISQKIYPKKNVHVVVRSYVCIFCVKRYMKQNHIYKVCDLNPFPEELQCRFESATALARHIKDFHKEVNRKPKDLATVKKCSCGNFMTSASATFALMKISLDAVVLESASISNARCSDICAGFTFWFLCRCSD
ncbi:hypothetical protein ACS0TY_015916 [Phlomoides rotata]